MSPEIDIYDGLYSKVKNRNGGGGYGQEDDMVSLVDDKSVVYSHDSLSDDEDKESED